MNQETDVVAQAFCIHKGCSFSPQTVYKSTLGPGGDVEWLQGRKAHHDETHEHKATIIIYDSSCGSGLGMLQGQLHTKGSLTEHLRIFH